MRDPIWPISSETVAEGSSEGMQNGFTCPVCGYVMSVPPCDFHICPSCGTEYGNDDLDWTHEQLRSAWMLNGFQWWSKSETKPPDWNPFEQVLRVILVTIPKEDIDTSPITGQSDEIFPTTGEGTQNLWAFVRRTSDSEVTCLR